MLSIVDIASVPESRIQFANKTSDAMNARIKKRRRRMKRPILHELDGCRCVGVYVQ